MLYVLKPLFLWLLSDLVGKQVARLLNCLECRVDRVLESCYDVLVTPGDNPLFFGVELLSQIREGKHQALFLIEDYRIPLELQLSWF